MTLTRTFSGARPGLSAASLALTKPFLLLGQIGDSRNALQMDGAGISCNAPAHWIGYLSGQRIQCPTTLNGAVGGEKSDQTLRRVQVGGGGGSYAGTTYAALNPAVSGGTGTTGPLAAYFAAAGVRFVLDWLPINDHNVGNAYPLATMKANKLAIWQALQAVGITVVCLTSHPHDAAFTPAWTSQQLDYQANLRDWLLGMAGQPGLIPIDITDLFVDTTTGLAASTTLRDGTHPSVAVDYQIASRVVSALLPYAGSYNPLPVSNRDVFSADNPRGNLLPNGMLLGTGGTISAGGSTASGQVANSWSLVVTNGSGLTVTPSKVVTGGVEWQQIAISGTTSSAADIRVEMYPTAGVSLANAPIGSAVETCIQVSTDGGSAGINQNAFGPTAAGQFYFDGAMPSQSRTFLPSVAHAGICRAPTWTIPAGAANLLPRHRIILPASTAVSLTTRLRAAGCYRVG